jgi:hypothetical protein
MTNYPEVVSVGNEARNVGTGDRSGDGRAEKFRDLMIAREKEHQYGLPAVPKGAE